MRLVLVEWVDSHSEGGWQQTNDALRAAERNSLTCETIGYLAEKNDRYVLVAASRTTGRDDEAKQLGDVMQIPCSAITGMRSLTAGRRAPL